MDLRREYTLDRICARGYDAPVWDIEITDQFVEWWSSWSGGIP